MYSCEGHSSQHQLCHHQQFEQFFSFLVITQVLKYFMTVQHQLCIIIISSQPWESCQKLHWKFEKPPPLQRVISMIIILIITINAPGGVLIWPSPFSILKRKPTYYKNVCYECDNPCMRCHLKLWLCFLPYLSENYLNLS